MAEQTAGLEIRVNDVVLCRGYGDEDSINDPYTEYFTGTCAVEVELLVGDLVNVKLWEENFVSGALIGEMYTGFSGALQSVTV